MVPRLVPISEAIDQRLLGVSRGAVYRLIASGEIATVKIGRRRFITEDAIAEFIDRHTEAVAS